MRIAVVHSFYASTAPSGENTVVQMQVAELRRAGHEVQLFELRTDDLASGRFYKLSTALNVATGSGANPSAEISEFRPDIVHVHNLFPNFSTNWLRNCPFPVVATIHNFRPMCAAGTLFRAGESCTKCPDAGQHHALINACYKGSRAATLPLAIRNAGGLKRDSVLSRADELIFLSERSRQTYIQFGQPSERCSILPNFVPASTTSFGNPSGAWIYAGRLTEEKGIIDLLREWPAKQRLKILGDGPCMDEAQTMAGPNVHFEGSVSHQDVLRELAGAVGLVLPSKWAEGLPTIYLEALAAGLPVITRAGNSAADDISIFGHGTVYSDSRELPGAVESVQSDWNSLSTRARERYMTAYTPAAWLEGIMRSYDNAIAHREASHEARN